MQLLPAPPGPRSTSQHLPTCHSSTVPAKPKAVPSDWVPRDVLSEAAKASCDCCWPASTSHGGESFTRRIVHAADMEAGQVSKVRQEIMRPKPTGSLVVREPRVRDYLRLLGEMKRVVPLARMSDESTNPMTGSWSVLVCSPLPWAVCYSVSRYDSTDHQSGLTSKVSHLHERYVPLRSFTRQCKVGQEQLES
jgi:hypothetical protein